MPSKKKNSFNVAGVGGGGYVPQLLGDEKKDKFDEKSLEDRFNTDEFETIVRPIFIEHKKLPSEDEDVTPEILKKIVEKFNLRKQATGDLPVVTLGHTPNEGEDKPEPPVIGYATRFELGKIYNKKLKKDVEAIIATMPIYKDRYEEAKRNPRVSIELWSDLVCDPIALLPDKQPIDTIAFLGAERPALDMGLHFSKKSSGKHKYSYQIPEETEPMDKEEFKKMFAECMAEHKQFEAEQAKVPADEEKYDEAVAGENAPELPKDEEDESPAPAKLKMQYEQTKRRYAALEAKVTKYEKDILALKNKATLAERENDLRQVESEGYSFEFADELEYVKDLEPKRYAAHLAKMRKNYKQAPINVQIPVADPAQRVEATQESFDPQSVYRKVCKGNFAQTYDEAKIMQLKQEANK